MATDHTDILGCLHLVLSGARRLYGNDPIYIIGKVIPDQRHWPDIASGVIFRCYPKYFSHSTSPDLIIERLFYLSIRKVPEPDEQIRFRAAAYREVSSQVDVDHPGQWVHLDAQQAVIILAAAAQSLDYYRDLFLVHGIPPDFGLFLACY